MTPAAEPRIGIDEDRLSLGRQRGAHASTPSHRSSASASASTSALPQIARLQRLYGQDTAIRFRYVHDFIYGYDWAKWVGRDPDLRAGIGPYDAVFLDHLERRAHELLGLIAVDDPVYPGLPDEQARNPFPFSREPEAELRLHRTLAARGLLPLAAWDPAARPVWSRPFAALRAELAAMLGLTATDACAARG